MTDVFGWVKIDEVREHFESVGCGTIYKDGGRGRVPLCLAQPKQEQGEPVAWVCYGAPGKRDIDFEEADINGLPIGTSLYTAPPQRKPLTDEEIRAVSHETVSNVTTSEAVMFRAFARAIEAAHGIKE
jgi:hypothetical protein